jgi:hypothetical protein
LIFCADIGLTGRGKELVQKGNEAELDRKGKVQIEKRDRPGFSRDGGEGLGKGIAPTRMPGQAAEMPRREVGATGFYIVWAILVYGGLA